jgi:hypothetical protein
MNIDRPPEADSIYLVIVVLIFSYWSGSAIGQSAGETVNLVFNISQEQEIYDQSDYGEPPQFAIWLEDPERKITKTVFVTYRTATGDFEGKIECPLSLPFWIGVFRNETGRKDFPRPWKPFYDAVTGATPKGQKIEVSVNVRRGITWLYFIEVNVAGDYNKTFPYVSEKKKHDNHGNGQPSVLFKGEILAQIKETSVPDLVGRSEQYSFSQVINPDLEGIDTAKKVFSTIVVSCEGFQGAKN